MKIDPCRDELLPNMIFLPLYYVIMFFLNWYFGWELFVIVCSVIAIGVITVMAGWSYLYMGRTIYLTSEGCTFSSFMYSKAYEWKDLNVQFCQNEYSSSYFLDIPGPGIMIYDKTLKLPSSRVSASWCRIWHPVRSVFIRFRSEQDCIHSIEKATSKYTYGYAVEKDVIEGYLKSIGVY